MRCVTLKFAASSVLLAIAAGCGALDVSDPTVIEEADVANATGADLLRRDALGRFYNAMPDHISWTGMLSDELTIYHLANSIDRRDTVSDLRRATLTSALSPQTGFIEGGPYMRWHLVRSAATLAIHADGGQRLPRARRGELFAIRGFATLNLAEGFCAGFPLHDIVDGAPIYGSPLSTEEVFERALVDFDSALVHAADSARIDNFAKLGRARALVGLGRLADAATIASSVQTSYTSSAEFTNTFSVNSNDLAFWDFGRRRSVADREGANGLDFISAQDPRVQTVLIFTNTFTGQRVFAPAKYVDNHGAPIIIASGVEARLIEAEAALRTGDANWLSILNNLRATQINPALPSLSDPGNDVERVDLLFRERAFWLFLTGHRLWDLRRLVTVYGRPAETVFPIGPYPRGGGTYGSATSIAFPVELERPHNPAVKGCTSS